MPLTVGVDAEEDARRVLGFWPDQALGAGGCDCCLLLFRDMVSMCREERAHEMVQRGSSKK